MIYEILTGEQPFKGEQPMQIAYQHANDSVPKPSSACAGIPVELDELVLWATARDPDDRPLNARVMLDRLLEIEKQTRSLESTSEFADRQTVLIAPTREVVERETQAIGSVPRHKTQPLAANHASALTFAAARRRKRGYWLFVCFSRQARRARGGISVPVPARTCRFLPSPASILVRQRRRSKTPVSRLRCHLDPI